MPNPLPEGNVLAPSDGSLPVSVLTDMKDRRLGLYIHVPFCAVRCGYCDFNTYTAAELGKGVSQASYAAWANHELEFAARVMERRGCVPRPLSTVFFGGGTPTLLPSQDLASMLRRAADLWGMSPEAEVTVEANPESVTYESLGALRDAGVNRVSIGMQSADPHILQVLDRTHRPERVPQVVRWAQALGLQVSVDLIYGTPGESMEQWRSSLLAALDTDPDHISAYSLTVETGTRLAAKIRRGVLDDIDEDEQAEKYVLAEELCSSAGLRWYEISNWARGEQHICRHNMGYWRGDDWWGIGPGAHSHMGGVRWWNVKHPAAYAQRLQAGASPAHGREVLDVQTRALERLMLGIRLAEGLDIQHLPVLLPPGSWQNEREIISQLIAQGLVQGEMAFRGRLVLTLRGRLLADTVVQNIQRL